MRKIKYRVWVYEEDIECWIKYPVEELIWEYNPDKLFVAYRIGLGKAIQRVDTNRENTPIVEEYLDIPDKNEIEICEGDKVNVFVRGNRKPLICTIEKRHGNFCLVGGEGYVNCTVGDYAYDIEIIGNIHEK